VLGEILSGLAIEQAKNELVNDELNKQIENLEEEKEKLLEQLRTKSTDSASFRKQQSEIDRLKQQLKERESVLTDTREELKSVKETLGQLQSLLEQKEVEAKVPETRNQDTQAVDKSSNRKISGLRQENKKLTRDKQIILAQLKPKIEEIVKLKENLKQLQEENKQLKQKATKNIGVDTSSSTDQKETKEMEVQTDVKKDDFRDLYDKKGKYVRTELSDPSLTSVDDPEKSRHKA